MSATTADNIVLEKSAELIEAYRAALSAGYVGGTVHNHGNGISSTAYDTIEPWQIIDNWGGGQPSRGITWALYEGKLCWAMTYHDEIFDQTVQAGKMTITKSEVKAFLKEALLQPLDPPTFELLHYMPPVRGPASYHKIIPVSATGIRGIALSYDCLRPYTSKDVNHTNNIGKFEIVDQITLLDPTDLHREVLYRGHWEGGWTNLR